MFNPIGYSAWKNGKNYGREEVPDCKDIGHHRCSSSVLVLDKVEGRVFWVMSDRLDVGVGGGDGESGRSALAQHWHVKIRRSAECKIHHGCPDCQHKS